MSATVLGTVTIGQAPRPDVTPIVEAQLPPGVACRHVGLLDGLSDEAIAARYVPAPCERRLVTRLLDGRAVELGAGAVEAGLQAAIEGLERDGCTAILVLCTGAFDALRTHTAVLLEPDRIVPPIVAAVAGRLQVGVLVPLPSQMESERTKWAALAQPPLAAAASPYTDAEAVVAEAARDLRGRGARVIVMDCIGYTARHRQAAREATGLPVLLSNELVARVAGACVIGA